MGNAVDFEGSNKVYGPPKGEEERVGSLHVFFNGSCIVSAHELSDDEIEEIVRTRRVFLSIWSGGTLFPLFVGAESVVRSVVVDFGKVW